MISAMRRQLCLDVETGQTLAYVGNISHPENRDMESDVDVIGAPRSPGSTLNLYYMLPCCTMA
jgi:membrane carboxypeptidase/penicillin-binding protein PbpC